MSGDHDKYHMKAWGVSGNRVIKQNLIVDRLLRKLKKTYAKMLSAYARRKLAKAYELEDKAIRLELELKDKQP